MNGRDERYTHLHGKKVLLPLMSREIPIIPDELAQPEFGTGAVKVTPAHDPNDFLAGLRHNLPQIDIMDEQAHMNGNAGCLRWSRPVRSAQTRAGRLGSRDFLSARRITRSRSANAIAAKPWLSRGSRAVVRQDSAARGPRN